METCATIHDLPPEILQRVFLPFVEDWHANLWDTSDLRDNWKLLFFWETTLLHICKTWTALAKATPDLWSHIHFPLAGDELDRRVMLSSGVTLKVFGSSWLTAMKNKVAFHEFPERLKPPILSEWLLTAPGAASLTCLVFHVKHVASNLDNEAALVKVLASSCPRLLKLDLSSFSPLQLQALPTTLQILILRCRSRPPQPFGMGYLVSLCYLRVLELSSAYFSSDSNFVGNNFYPPPSIELPSLETLSLADAALKTIQTPLAVLDTPPLVKLQVQCTIAHPVDDYFELYNTLSWLCQSVEGAIGDYLQVTCGGVGYTHIVLDWKRRWSDDSDPILIHLDVKRPKFISIEHEKMAAWCADVMDFVLQLCRSMSSETLLSVDMRFTGPYMLTTDDWVYAFGDPSLTGLEELKVHRGTWSESLLDALTETKDSGDEREDLFMPSLRRLQLTNAVFERIDGEVDTNGLRAMLLRRRKRGAGIEKFIFTKCTGLTEGDHNQLKELVGELIVMS